MECLIDYSLIFKKYIKMMKKKTKWVAIVHEGRIVMDKKEVAQSTKITTNATFIEAATEAEIDVILQSFSQINSQENE